MGKNSYTADELKALRKALGMTEKELGDLIGVRAETISRWCNGHSRPSGLALRSLARVLPKP